MRRAAALFCCLFLLPVCAAGEAAEALRFEAEDGSLTGHLKTGRKEGVIWVEGFTQAGADQLDIPAEVPAEGFYDVAVIQASQGGHKENPVMLDGQSIGSVAADGTDFARAVLEHIYFSAGAHTVSVGTSWGYVRVDAVELTPSKPLPADLYEVSHTLCTPNPAPETQRLFDWMCEIYGKKIISGQYCDGGMNGLEVQAVWRATGKKPAILGLDMMDYTPSRVAKGGEADRSVPFAIEYAQAGGIVTFCWHWNAPEPYLKDPWYSGFYSDHSTINLRKIMDGGDKEGYDLLIRDIDAIAVQLKRLRDAGVPVLWRPLHEASGGWFWWGKYGAEPYLWLYNLLYDRLTNEHGLNNLIWVWNGQDAAWYPGDDKVDIIGTDIYAGEHVYDSQSAAFIECMKVTGARKMVILSENGTVPDTELIFRDGTVWGSWCTWGGEFVLKSAKFNRPSEQYTEVELLKKVYGDERVVSREDLPSFTGE